MRMAPPALRIPELAARLPGRWAAGRRRTTAHLAPEALLAALTQGGGADWGMLEWLHVLRHKARWDVSHPHQAEATASQIWRMAIGRPELQAQVVARLVDGLCGGEGLPGSMMAVFQRERPLAREAPLLQDIIAALARVREDPHALIRLCVEHNRAPRALLRRVELPDDLPVLDQVESAIPAFMQASTAPPEAARAAAQWLLAALAEAQPTSQDRIAAGLLVELTHAEARSIPDLCWWLEEVYRPTAPRSRHRFLPPAAQAALAAWQGSSGDSTTSG